MFVVTSQDIDRGDKCCLSRSPIAFGVARCLGGPATFHGYYLRSWNGQKFALPLSAIQWWDKYKATGQGGPGCFVLIPAEFDIHDPAHPPEKGPAS